MQDTISKKQVKEALEKLSQAILERKRIEGDFEIKLSNGLVGKFIRYKNDRLALILNSVPGPQGERGEQGISGEPGLEGLIGKIGPKGDKGDKGKPGAFGLRGEVGLKGEVGERGFAGAKGDISPRGEKGEKGLEGLTGKTGAKGDIGDRGLTGESGEQGLKGIKGDRGEKGVGVPGERGEIGYTGEKGAEGKIGPRGIQGLTGDMPDHEWGGTQIRFQKPNGKWGVFVDLQGPSGEQGGGRSVLSPAIFTGPKVHERNSDPTVNDDEYRIGDTWINLASNEVWVLVDNTKGAAVWLSNTPGDHDHTVTGDGGVLSGDMHDTFSNYQETITPSDPTQNSAILFMRASGSNIEFVMRSSTGDEVVIASLSDTAIVHTNTLALNWIE